MALDKLPKDILIKLILLKRKNYQKIKFVDEKIEVCEECKNLYLHSKEKLIDIFFNNSECYCREILEHLIETRKIDFLCCDYPDCEVFETDRKTIKPTVIDDKLYYYCKKHFKN